MPEPVTNPAATDPVVAGLTAIAIKAMIVEAVDSALERKLPKAAPGAQPMHIRSGSEIEVSKLERRALMGKFFRCAMVPGFAKGLGIGLDQVEKMNHDLIDGTPGFEAGIGKTLQGESGSGTFIIPEEWFNEILTPLAVLTDFEKYAHVINMGKRALHLPKETAAPAMTWISTTAGGAGEAATIPLSDPTLNEDILNPWPGAVGVDLGRDMIDDVEVDVVSYAMGRLAEAIMKGKQAAFATGNGTGKPLGIEAVGYGGLGGVGTLDFDTVAKIVFSIKSSYRARPGCVYVGNNNTLRVLLCMTDGFGRPIFMDALGAGASPAGYASPLRFPVCELPDMTDGVLGFGNLYYGYRIGNRKIIEVRQTDVGGDAWGRNIVKVQALCRVGGMGKLLESFTINSGITTTIGGGS